MRYIGTEVGECFLHEMGINDSRNQNDNNYIKNADCLVKIYMYCLFRASMRFAS